jgi:molybdate transport system regulatory protein
MGAGFVDSDMTENAKSPRLRIRIVFGDKEMIGPGKAELLARIDRCGSIAAAGREMGMSYKRAWELVGTLNAMFRDPLVESTRGGPGGGGAVLTVDGPRSAGPLSQLSKLRRQRRGHTMACRPCNRG